MNAQAPVTAYDRPGVIHNVQCVRPSHGGRVLVRNLEGGQLQTLGGPVSEPPEARETCSGVPSIRVEGIEAVSSGGMRMYYSWPLEGGEQAAGFVAAAELASSPVLDGADAAGNGAAAPPAPGEPVYRVAPVDIAFAQRYAGASARQWYTYSVYGRPVGGAGYALMSWSWVNVAGGGIARAAVSEGELFHPANVQAITLASSAGTGFPPGLRTGSAPANLTASAPANGTVTARYGYVSDGAERVYGWMVTSHTFHGICYDHMAYAGGGPALAGTLCPQGALADAIADGLSWGAEGAG